MKRLPESELEIMMIIWELDKPVTRLEIEEQMTGEHRLSATTILSFLSRLQKKGFLKVEKSGKNNIYISKIKKEEYLQTESKHIFKRLYKNSVKNFLAALFNADHITEEDMKDLEEFLEQKREELARKQGKEV